MDCLFVGRSAAWHSFCMSTIDDGRWWHVMEARSGLFTDGKSEIGGVRTSSHNLGREDCSRYAKPTVGCCS